ncbi:MAG: hypothetical protein ACLQFR_12825 [Streptosporangiaceae bacterium]
MTAQQQSARPASAPSAAEGWRASAPELAFAAALVSVTTLAVYLYAGTGTAVAAIAGWAAVVLAALRWIVPPTAKPLEDQTAWHGLGRTSFIGYWRKRAMLTDATTSMVSYDAELRPTLQHLLAARLAERHGISLYQEPDVAKRLLLQRSGENALWYWLDPRRPAESDQRRRGIPPRTLAAIIDRLERL